MYKTIHSLKFSDSLDLGNLGKFSVCNTQHTQVQYIAKNKYCKQFPFKYVRLIDNNLKKVQMSKATYLLEHKIYNQN